MTNMNNLRWIFLTAWVGTRAILMTNGFSANNGVRPLQHKIQPKPTLSSTATGEFEESTLSTSPSLEPSLEQMQQRHRNAAASFVPSTFNPHPVLTNPHVQTILGVFLRKYPECAYTEPGPEGLVNVMKAISKINEKRDEEKEKGKSTFWDERQRITTSCEQDFYHADVKYATQKQSLFQSKDSKGLVILIHGLESNSNSSLSVDMSRAYVNRGFDVVCLNFRGCCGQPNDTLGGYHLGFTDDLRHFLRLIREKTHSDPKFDKRPIYISGYSLGANVVVKCLGELQTEALTKYNIHGAAVMGAPFDAERNIQQLDSPGFNRVVYSGNFLKSLKKRAQYQLDAHCESDPTTGAFDYPNVMSAKTVAEYDNAYIAKIYGFKDNIEYYRKNSCVYFMADVAVPLLIVNAGDDPFFDPDFCPFEFSVDGGGSAPIKIERTKYGGHLGFMFHQLSESEKMEGGRVSSWLPTELSRFITHVHEFDYDSKVFEESEWSYL